MRNMKDCDPNKLSDQTLDAAKPHMPEKGAYEYFPSLPNPRRNDLEIGNSQSTEESEVTYGIHQWYPNSSDWVQPRKSK